MGGTVQEIASVVKEIVGTRGPIAGSLLAPEMKGRFPGWKASDFKVRSLREFIDKHVPDVKVVGRSGMDVIYGLAGTVPRIDATPTVQATSEPLSATGDFWRAWVSPNSPHAFAIARDSGAVQAVPRQATVPASQFRVDPLEVADHRSIARAFLARLPSGVQERLAPLVESTADTWWQEWLKELRGTEHLAEWNVFRRQQLEELLRSRLGAAGLATEAIESAIKSVHDSHETALARSKGRATRSMAVAARAADSDEAIKRLVMLAVQKMSIAELRELRFPLGVVLDALAAPKSR